jgi:hypothetical protein
MSVFIIILKRLSTVPNFIWTGQGISSRQTPENWHLPLKAYIAIALQCEETLRNNTIEAAEDISIQFYCLIIRPLAGEFLSISNFASCATAYNGFLGEL